MTTTATMQRIEQATLACATRLHGGDRAYEAHIAAPATWHVVTVASGCDRIAAAHLLARRFGIYLPEMPNKHGARDLLLPGYLFVFVFGVAAHARRILACPGVVDFLSFAGEIVAVPDSFISDVRELENREMAAVEYRGNRRRKGYRRRATLQEGQSDALGARAFSAWIDAMEGVAPEKRIGLFLAAIGIGPESSLSRIESP